MILLLGASGLLGRALAADLASAGAELHRPSRREIDLSRPESVEPAVRRIGPDAVVNAAAFADVGRAESPEARGEVFLVNRDAPEALARVCGASGIPLVHLSTDYVFDGALGRPYREDDPVRPLQVYGRSKLEGERAVARHHRGALIVRTSTLFGARPGRPTYVDAILEQAKRQRVVEVVETPVSSPTYAPDLSAAILDLLDRRASGLVHVVNDGHCSRYELACAVVEIAGLTTTTTVRTRPPGPTGPARPPYSALDVTRFTSLTGAPLRPWRAALAEYLAVRAV